MSRRLLAAVAILAVTATGLAGCASEQDKAIDGFAKAVTIADSSFSEKEARKIGECMYNEIWSDLGDGAKKAFAGGKISEDTLDGMNRKNQRLIRNALMVCASQ